MAGAADGCGCFPTGRHYPGIAHLLRAVVRGTLAEFSADVPWQELPVAMLDVETTGRDAQNDRVVELGIVVGQAGQILRRHNWLINPGRPIPDDAKAVHGISDDDVKNEKSFAALQQEIAEALRGTVPAAYNAGFDKGFVLAEFERNGGLPADVETLSRKTEWLDPLVWARELYAEERSRTLGDMAKRLGVKLENAHRASDDAEAALHVLYRMADDPRMPKAYGAFVQEQRRLALKQADERRMWRGGG